MHLLFHPRLLQAQQLVDMPLRNPKEPSTDQTVDHSEERIFICIWNKHKPVMPGEMVVLTTLKIPNGGAYISQVILLLSLHSFLVCKDPLCGRNDVQEEVTQLDHHSCIRIDKWRGGIGGKLLDRRWGRMRRSLNMNTNMHPFQEGAMISTEGFTTLSSDRLILKYLKRWVKIIAYGEFLVRINKWLDSMKSMMRWGMLTLMLFRR